MLSLFCARPALEPALAFGYVNHLLGPFAETEVVLPLAVLLEIVHWPRSFSQAEVVLTSLVAGKGGLVEGPATSVSIAQILPDPYEVEYND